MVALRDRMRSFLEGWATDLPKNPQARNGRPTLGWRQVFENCPNLDFDAIPETANIADNAAVWPRRRVWQPTALVRQANICRAFDGVEPNDVRVVVLGQDPYPLSTKATGRAFEDGNWDGLRPQSLSQSIKLMMLASWSTQENHAALFRAGGWGELIRAQGFVLPGQGEYFDYLARKGVLFVNSAWTHTNKDDINHHLNLWRPVTNHLLQYLASRATAPLIFVLLGDKAQKAFDLSGARAAAENVGKWGHLVVSLELPHPGRPGLFLRRNPWALTNEQLRARGEEDIEWWPQDLAPIG